MAPAVPDFFRIEMTPKLDGKIDDEEWDPFSTDGAVKTYLQWEPGVIYAAATGPAGQDLLVSLDLGADGWLVGDDNLEARVSTSSGKPTVSVRQLDGSNKAGPVWRDLPGFAIASEVASSTDGTNVTYELRLVDPGLGMIPTKPAKIDVRIDLIPSTDAPRDPFIPRSLAEVQLATSRSAALPTGVKWNVERSGRAVAPGDRMFVRLTFNSKPPVPLKKIDLRSEGSAKDDTNQVSIPFPGWDGKGRSFVDYDTKIDLASDTGYHVLRGTITAADGTPAIVEASYRVAPAVDFDIVQKTLADDSHDRSIPFGYYLTSNIDRFVKGEVEVSVPAPLKLVNSGDVHKFAIGEQRGRLRNSIELFVPANSAGSYPLVFKVTANGVTRTYTKFLNVE
jgi:hypothetical protein